MSVMAEIAAAVLAAMQGGAPVVTATVVQSGVAELPAGEKMLVRPDGSTIGALGGGPVEEAVIRHCVEAIRRHAVETIRLEMGPRCTSSSSYPSRPAARRSSD